MSSYQQQFLGTPTFELFRRGLLAQTIQKFRGINSWSTLAQLGPEWAQDVLNVIISGSGGLSKLRLPVPLSVAIQNQNTGPSSFWDFQQANGNRFVVSIFGRTFYVFTNDMANVTMLDSSDAYIPPWSFVVANNMLFGMNGSASTRFTGAARSNWGVIPPQFAPAPPGVIAGSLSPASGYTYGYSWKRSDTGDVSNISPVSASTGPQANKGFTVLALASTDAQIDTIVWFRNLDSGGDQFRLAEVNINTGVVTTFAAGANVIVTGGTGNLGITDNTPDGSLDQTQRGPLINNPPLFGKFLALGQNRVFIFNLTGPGQLFGAPQVAAPQDVIYSGYEQIFLGRPESCFPPNNRLRLSIGAEQIAGGGVLQSGVVAFSQTGRMYMLRGQVEDITLAVPVNFTQYLEELPWTLGCASHYTIQTTPYGLVWLAGDKTVQLFDGRSEPIDISVGLYPYLRRITPGTEANCVAAYFNWLERDFYMLLAAVDGSLTNNRIFFFAFNKQIGTDEIESVEAFVSDLPATLPGAIPWMGLITNSRLQRLLCISAQGRIQQLPVSSDTVGGVTTDLTIIPPTSGNLNAYWRGGYFGNDSPQRSKLFRWLRLITDQDPKSFLATLRYVDDEQRTFVQPEIVGPVKFPGSRLGLNHRAKRCSIEIDFPAKDAPANVLEMQVTSVPTSDR